MLGAFLSYSVRTALLFFALISFVAPNGARAQSDAPVHFEGLEALPLTRPEAEKFEMGVPVKREQFKAWTVYSGDGFCAADAPSVNDPRTRFYIGISSDTLITFAGAMGPDRPSGINLFLDSQMALKIDNSEPVHDHAKAIIRAEPPFDSLVPSLLVVNKVDLPGVVTGDSLGDLLTVAGLRALQGLRADIDPRSFWASFRRGSELHFHLTAPDGAKRVVLAQGTVSLAGSSNTFRAVMDCALSLSDSSD